MTASSTEPEGKILFVEVIVEEYSNETHLYLTSSAIRSYNDGIECMNLSQIGVD